MLICNLTNCNCFDIITVITILHLSMLHFTDFQHKITVQASPSMDKRRSLHSTSSSPPSSPTLIPRLRAIQRKTFFFLCTGSSVFLGLDWLKSTNIRILKKLTGNLGRGTVSFAMTKAMWTKAAEPQAVIQLFEQFDLVMHQRPCNNWNKFLLSIYDWFWHSDRGHRCLFRLTVFIMVRGDHWYGSQFCKIAQENSEWP